MVTLRGGQKLALILLMRTPRTVDGLRKKQNQRKVRDLESANWIF